MGRLTIVGAGYVGLSLAVLLSQHNDVVVLDIDSQKADKINHRVSPIRDPDIENFLKSKKLSLKATADKEEAYNDADYIIIATPTNYDHDKAAFDTSSVEQVIEEALFYNKKALIVIKSTVPVGFTESMRERFGVSNILFSPEFLREGKALYDNLYPSRIVVGDKTKEAKNFAKLLLDGAIKKDVPVLLTGSSEAEAIKLFSNAYLAMRVAFFNELDTFAELKGLDTKEIIEGVCLEPRIGNFYNNPSFGYGGYCLPKDTSQLASQFNGIPHEIMTAIVKSNQIRKEHIANMVIRKKPKTVGIYKLVMKKGSDNFRTSSILDIINILKNQGKTDIIIYEPLIEEDTYEGLRVVNSLEDFKRQSDLILANRKDNDLEGVEHKVYTRDLFNDN
ncbi:MAG TPA: UDP-glucose 6-dehydrogenase [Eubacteriaceae bacterium]|nr:UDP-glucose 6-dehydrogenase [Eubacteriaceae bacterium]